MDSGDFGQLSSFSQEIQQKSFLTFYEEQWNSQIEAATKLQQIEATSIRNHQKQTQTKKINIKNQSVFQNPPRKITLPTNNLQKSIISKKQPEKIRKKLIEQDFQRRKPFNSYSFHKFHREKQNIHKKTKDGEETKQSAAICSKIKQRSFQTLKIKSFQFQQRDQQSDMMVNQICKHHLANIRMRKISSFKGLYEKNVNLLCQSLPRQTNKATNSTSQLRSKNQESFSKVFTNPQRYLFPIIAPEYISLKNKYLNRQSQPIQDRLDRFWTKFRSKQQRKTDVMIRNTKIV